MTEVSDIPAPFFGSHICDIYCQTPSKRRTNGQETCLTACQRVAATSTRRNGGDRGGRCWCAYTCLCPSVRSFVRLLDGIWHLAHDVPLRRLSFLEETCRHPWNQIIISHTHTHTHTQPDSPTQMMPDAKNKQAAELRSRRFRSKKECVNSRRKQTTHETDLWI